METLLVLTEQLSTITKLDFESIASFLCDIFHATEPENQSRLTSLVDEIYTMATTTAVPPDEFFDGFTKTRSFLLNNKIELSEYFTILRKGLEKGIDPALLPSFFEEKI